MTLDYQITLVLAIYALIAGTYLIFLLARSFIDWLGLEIYRRKRAAYKRGMIADGWEYDGNTDQYFKRNGNKIVSKDGWAWSW